MDLLKIGSAGAERGADGRGETLLQHALLLYTNSDVEVQCQAAIGSAQAGSGSDYYPNVTVGSKNAACFASSDYPRVGQIAEFWQFEITGPQATYKDDDNPLALSGLVYKFVENDCNSNTMNDAGVWSHVTLADVFH